MSPDELYNHESARLSELDLEMVRAVPPGGNWKNIPDETVAKSKRLQQIRRTGGRTTYYGRLTLEKPSYTISTFFNRPGNGCFIHPIQDRLISHREAARLQSFPDSFRFFGSKLSRYKQIGNAVPPLMARAIAAGIKGTKYIDLFAGAGGLALGFEKLGFKCLVATDIDKNMCETLRKNNLADLVFRADLSRKNNIDNTVEFTENRLSGRTLDLIVAGPPCQGFSTAGNWDENDPRNSLYIPLLMTIEKTRPTHVLIENVLGISSMRKGEVLRKIEEKLGSYGYCVKVARLKVEQYGVPQRRRRVFIFGSLARETVDFPPKPLFKSMDSRGCPKEPQDHLPEPISVGEAISDLPAINSGEGEEVMKYNNAWIKSDFQRWLRGQISFEKLYAKILERKV